MSPSRLPLHAPGSLRDRIAEALLSHTGSRMYAEWEQLMEWEDKMLAFANEAAARADRLEAALRRIAYQPFDVNASAVSELAEAKAIAGEALGA